MTEPATLVNEGLDDVLDAVRQMKSAVELHRTGKTEKGWLETIEKEIRVNSVLENLHLHMARLCLQDRDVAEVLIKLELVSQEDLAVLSDKEEQVKLQAALEELSKTLEEARALIEDPVLVPYPIEKWRGLFDR
jgi:hypothetical protein